MKFSLTRKKIFFHVGIATVAAFSSLMIGTDGASSQSSLISDIHPMNQEVFMPPGDGAPRQTVGGASRGNCPTGSLSDVSVSRTSSGISVKLPSGMAQQVFFSLKDANHKTVYQGFMPVTQDTVQVNSNMLGNLNAQSSYTWGMAIICGKALRPDSPSLEGTL